MNEQQIQYRRALAHAVCWLVDVTHEDIREGCYSDVGDCAIARAMSRAYGCGHAPDADAACFEHARVHLNDTTVHLSDTVGAFRDVVDMYLPPVASEFISRFDTQGRENVEPIAFRCAPKGSNGRLDAMFRAMDAWKEAGHA